MFSQFRTLLSELETIGELLPNLEDLAIQVRRLIAFRFPHERSANYHDHIQVYGITCLETLLGTLKKNLTLKTRLKRLSLAAFPDERKYFYAVCCTFSPHSRDISDAGEGK